RRPGSKNRSRWEFNPNRRQYACLRLGGSALEAFGRDDHRPQGRGFMVPNSLGEAPFRQQWLIVAFLAKR
ncbi:MAG TPA: hypothetical protein PLS55_14885, partial [Thermogutta sp.]|nr:hypothetical protein [Thermogutta sp.]